MMDGGVVVLMSERQKRMVQADAQSEQFILFSEVRGMTHILRHCHRLLNTDIRNQQINTHIQIKRQRCPIHPSMIL